MADDDPAASFRPSEEFDSTETPMRPDEPIPSEPVFASDPPSPSEIEETRINIDLLKRRGDVSWKVYSNQWAANSGTSLMLFAAAVFLIGGGILAYQQNRFRPPSFPTAQSIQSMRRLLVDANELHVDEDLPNKALGSIVDQDSTSVVRVNVTGAADDQGEIRVAVYHSQTNFNDVSKADWKGSISISEEGTAAIPIPTSALTSSFAIAAYQDVNENGILDRNPLGIPTERYGFTNNARGTIGPPSFDQAAIAKPDVDGLIEIELR